MWRNKVCVHTKSERLRLSRETRREILLWKGERERVPQKFREAERKDEEDWSVRRNQDPLSSLGNVSASTQGLTLDMLEVSCSNSDTPFSTSFLGLFFWIFGLG